MAAKAKEIQLARKLAFADAFVAAKFCVTEAARMAGFKGSDKVLCASGSRALADPAVRQRIRQRVEQAGVEAPEVLALLARHLRGDMADFLTAQGPVELDLETAREGKRLGLIKKFTQKKRTMMIDEQPVEETTITVELYGAQSAAELLGKALGVFAGDEGRGGEAMDVDSIVDRLIALGVPQGKWEPGFRRHYEARQRRTIESKVVG